MSVLSAVASVILLSMAVSAGEHSQFLGEVSQWDSFTRHDFPVDGVNVIVVEPAEGLPGRP